MNYLEKVIQTHAWTNFCWVRVCTLPSLPPHPCGGETEAGVTGSQDEGEMAWMMSHAMWGNRTGWARKLGRGVQRIDIRTCRTKRLGLG